MDFEGGVDPRVDSVAELLAILTSKDENVIYSGIQTLLRHFDKANPPGTLKNYVSSEPTIPKIMKLFTSPSKSPTNNCMVAIMWLMAAGLYTLDSIGRGAAEMAKIIIGEHPNVLYDCLSSGNAECLTAVMDLLTAICVDASVVSLLLTIFDLGDKGFAQASRIRKSSGCRLGFFSASPRNAYLKFIIQILNVSDFETRVSLSKQPALLHLALAGLERDSTNLVSSLLSCIKDRLVFNEEENRNLAVAFLRLGQLEKISRLLPSSKEKTREIACSFLKDCFSIPNRGLCYPGEPVHVLRNKLLLDLINSFDIVNDDSAQGLALALIKNCPDVAWAYLASNRVSLEPSPQPSFYLGVSLAIKLLNLIPSPALEDSATGLVPKCFTRAPLSRGIAHTEPMVRFNTLLIIIGILNRITAIPSPAGILHVKASLPDFRTVYNVWHQRERVISSEDDEFLERALVKVITNYIRLGLSGEVTATVIKAQDLWKIDGGSPDLAESVLELCRLLNPVSLLINHEDIKIIDNLCCTGKGVLVSQVLTDWILWAGITKDPSVAEKLGKAPEFQKGILSAISDIHHKPLLFPTGVDPLCSYLEIDKGSLVDEANSCNNEEEQGATPPFLLLSQENHQNNPTDDRLKKKRPFKDIDVDQVSKQVSTDDGVTFLNSLLTNTRRGRVMNSYASVPSDLAITKGVDSFIELLRMLLVEYNCGVWIQVMGAAVLHNEASRLDLRLLVDSGVLGYAIIGLSLREEKLRRCSHLILNRYSQLVRTSSLRGALQLSMLLGSLAAHINLDEPLAILPRLVTFFHAEAAPIMLRPEHPLYRPLNELFLAVPAVTPDQVFSRLFRDTTDLWEKELAWVLTWLDRTISTDGGVECLEQSDGTEMMHLADNVAILLLYPKLEVGIRKLAKQLLTKCRPSWLSTYENLINTNNTTTVMDEMIMERVTA